MLIQGLSDSIFQNLLNTEANNSVSYQSVLFMFSGVEPTSIEELDLVGNAAEVMDNLIHRAEGICFPNLTLDRNLGDNTLNILMSNGDVGGTMEQLGVRNSAYLADPDTQVYDLTQASTVSLGSCILYRPNNLWGNWATANSIPSLVIPNVLPQQDRLKTILELVGLNCLSGKKLRNGSQLSSFTPYLGRRGSTSSGVAGQDSHRAHVSLVFDAPVQADFLLFSMACVNNVATRSFSNVSLILPNNTLVELPAFTASQNITYVLNFTKTLIKGIRLATTHENYSALQAVFYATQLTAGLKNWQTETSLNDNTREPFTWGILVPSVNAAALAQPSRKLPMALVTGQEVEIYGRDEYYLRKDLVANRVLMSLPL